MLQGILELKYRENVRRVYVVFKVQKVEQITPASKEILVLAGRLLIVEHLAPFTADEAYTRLRDTNLVQGAI